MNQEEKMSNDEIIHGRGRVPVGYEKGRSPRITLSVSAEMRAWLNAESVRRGISRSDLVRLCVQSERDAAKGSGR